MVHRAPCVTLLAATFAASLAAQHVVTLPPPHALVDGTASADVPFGRGTPARVQIAYDAALFAGPATITAIAFQLDGTGENGVVVDCELLMSTLPVPAARLAPEFARNRGD